MPVQDRDPPQRQPHLERRAEHQVRHDFEAVEIDVRLVEAVEQHEGVGAGLVEPLGGRRQRAEVRTQLERDGDLHCGLDRLQDVDIQRLDLDAGLLGVGRDVVDVELDAVGAGLLHFLGVLGPPAGRHAVEAGDHGNVHGLLGFADEFQVLVGPVTVLLGLREVRQRLGEALGALFRKVVKLGLVVPDLLLEDGVEHDRGRALVAEARDRVGVGGERAGRGNERVLELQAHVGGREVHGCVLKFSSE